MSAVPTVDHSWCDPALPRPSNASLAETLTTAVKVSVVEDSETFTLHHQESLRGPWCCDARLRDGPALSGWLTARGLTRSLRAERLRAEQAAETRVKADAWVAAAPEPVADLAREIAANRPRPSSPRWSDQTSARHNWTAPWTCSPASTGDDRSRLGRRPGSSFERSGDNVMRSRVRYSFGPRR